MLDALPAVGSRRLLLLNMCTLPVQTGTCASHEPGGGRRHQAGAVHGWAHGGALRGVGQRR